MDEGVSFCSDVRRDSARWLDSVRCPPSCDHPKNQSLPLESSQESKRESDGYPRGNPGDFSVES